MEILLLFYMEDSSRKEVYKIILLGDLGVGKSNLRNYNIKREFDPNYHRTLEADYSV